MNYKTSEEVMRLWEERYDKASDKPYLDWTPEETIQLNDQVKQLVTRINTAKNWPHESSIPLDLIVLQLILKHCREAGRSLLGEIKWPTDEQVMTQFTEIFTEPDMSPIKLDCRFGPPSFMSHTTLALEFAITLILKDEKVRKAYEEYAGSWMIKHLEALVEEPKENNS